MSFTVNNKHGLFIVIMPAAAHLRLWQGGGFQILDVPLVFPAFTAAVYWARPVQWLSSTGKRHRSWSHHPRLRFKVSANALELILIIIIIPCKPYLSALELM
jgi:hypothetical protein